jgi:hypothetical protein
MDEIDCQREQGDGSGLMQNDKLFIFSYDEKVDTFVLR